MYRKPFWGGLHPGPTPASGAYCILPDSISRIIRAWEEGKRRGGKKRQMRRIWNGKGRKYGWKSDIVKN